MSTNFKKSQARKQKLRFKLRQVQKAACPRLTVHRTNLHIYAQVIDDENGKTLASASSAGKTNKLKNGGTTDSAKEVGKIVAEAAKKAGVSKVYFDRSGFRYHGRIKSLADSARENGLVF